MVLDGNSSQEYPVNVGVLQGSVLSLTFFLLCINDLSDDVIYNIAIYVDDTTLYSKCDQTSNLWQKLDFASFFFSFNWDSLQGMELQEKEAQKN